MKLGIVEIKHVHRRDLVGQNTPSFSIRSTAILKKIFLPLLLLPFPAIADISEEANACIDELMSRFGNVGGEVLNQEFSEAAIMVRLRDGNGIEYECIVWSGPEVAELRRIGGEADDGSGTMDVGSDSVQTVSGEQQVKLAPGTSGMTQSASLQPGTSVRYILGASDGQFLAVDVASRGGALDYKIFNPDGSLLLDLISSNSPYQGQLWQSGDHVVEVVNAGAQSVTFDIGIGIN